jgi:hypothetical protein
MTVRILEPLAGYVDNILFTPASLDKAILYATKEINDEIRYLRAVRDQLARLNTSPEDFQHVDSWRAEQAAAIKEILK